jgi:hypothetical protein
MERRHPGMTSCADRSGRKGVKAWARLRRCFGTAMCAQIRRGHALLLKRQDESEAIPDQSEVELGDGSGLLLILVLLFGAAGPDDLAEWAGMLAVEGLDEGFLKRRISGVGDEHTRPGDRLQQGPVQAQGEDQQQDGDGF